MRPVLETKAVSKTYEGVSTVTAVNNVSLSLYPGQFMGLVGPSGSGKTTLLAMLAGLLTPSAGQISIDGQDLSHMNESQRTQFRREKIGFTFQANNLIPYLTAQENVEWMLRINQQLDDAGRARVKELLARLGLGERLTNLPGQLSGGQQQRVAIARALIHHPSLVLADEPTASLDSERAYQVVKSFADLIHEQNRAGIMVTHDLRMCGYVDRVVQMLDGVIQREISDPQEIQALVEASQQQEQPQEQADADHSPS